MDTSKIKNILWIFGIIPFLLLGSCMIQRSSVPMIKNLTICDNNTALLAISAEYKMNMSTSKDVKFYLKEVTTGIIIAPDYRDNVYNNLYFNVAPGIYRILLITIKESTIAKSIVFNDSTKMFTKTLRLVNENQIDNPKSGLSFSGVILTGDKNLVYADTISNLIKIEPNSAYFLGEYQFEGYIEGVFNDMPNIRILKKIPASKEKIESFAKIYNETYLNSSKIINTTETIFNTDLIDLSKSNALKN